MADTTKTKVIDIKTQGSVKNVKSLKAQIKELKQEMANLEQGTEEYRKASVKLANLNQKQIEINEAMKYSNKDIGQTLSNLTNVATGAVASINAISASMQLLGIDSDESGEALKNIQLTMAVIQGMSAMDTAVKSLNGLKDAFLNIGKSSNDVQDAFEKTEQGVTQLGDARKGLNVATEKSAGAELAEATALSDNTAAMQTNNEEAVEYNKYQKENANNTLDSAEAINIETKAHGENTTAIDAEIEALRKRLAAEKEQANESGKSLGLEFVNKELAAAQEQLKGYNEELNRVMQNGDTGAASWYQELIDNITPLINSLQKWKSEIESGLIDDDTLAKLAEEGLFDELSEAVYEDSDAVQKVVDKYKELIPLMSDETFNDTIEGLEMLTGDFEDVDGEISAQAEDLQGAIKQLKEHKKAIDSDREAAAKGDKQINNTNKGIETQTKTLKKGREAWEAFKKSAMTALGIGAILAAVTWALSKLIDLLKSDAANGFSKDFRMLSEVSTEAGKNFQEQSAKVEILNKTLHDNTETMEDRKKALEELKKIVPDYHAQLTEEGQLINDNTTAIDNYLVALKEKITYQAYEQKYIQLLQDQIDKEAAIKEYEAGNWWFKLWHSKNARQKEYNETIRQQKVIWEQIKALNLSVALSDTKKGGGGGATQTLKTYIDYLKEIKTLLQNIWGTYFDELDLETTFNNYDPTKMFRSSINRILKTGKDVSGMFTDWFKDAMEKGIENLNPNDLNLNQIFKTDTVKELDDKLYELTKTFDSLKERYKNQKNLTAKQTKDWEKQKKQYEDQIADIKAQQKAVSDITNATENYLKSQDELKKKLSDLSKTRAMYEKQLQIEAQYQRQLGSEDELTRMNAEADKNIQTLRLEQTEILNVIAADQQRLGYLEKLPSLTKAESDELYNLKLELFNKNKELDEKETQVEENEYTKRTNRMTKFYADIDAAMTKRNNDRSNKSTANGWGTQDYNVQWDALMAQREAMEQKLAELKNQSDMSESERMQRMLDLQKEQADLEVQIEQEKVNRKININQTYYNALSQLSSGVSSLLQAEMENYDENSEQYKKLQVANAWIDTLSGTLSAFMSGMQSGIPAPWNVGLATTLAALTFAAGQQQIKNIENGTTSNAMSVSTPTTTYETLAYQNQSELLGNIADTKVYVTESDITTTQNKVKVRESNARY